ncbi:MAG: HNH endonuclease, partial [Gemmataceae bacterium]
MRRCRALGPHRRKSEDQDGENNRYQPADATRGKHENISAKIFRTKSGFAQRDNLLISLIRANHLFYCNLADLDRPGRQPKAPWEKIMAARKRKTLMVCDKCRKDIHAGRYNGTKSLSRKPFSPCTQGERGWGEGAVWPRFLAPLTPNPSPPKRGRGGLLGVCPESPSPPVLRGRGVGVRGRFGRGFLPPSPPIPLPRSGGE